MRKGSLNSSIGSKIESRALELLRSYGAPAKTRALHPELDYSQFRQLADRTGINITRIYRLYHKRCKNIYAWEYFAIELVMMANNNISDIGEQHGQ